MKTKGEKGPLPPSQLMESRATPHNPKQQHGRYDKTTQNNKRLCIAFGLLPISFCFDVWTWDFLEEQLTLVDLHGRYVFDD